MTTEKANSETCKSSPALKDVTPFDDSIKTQVQPAKHFAQQSILTPEEQGDSLHDREVAAWNKVIDAIKVAAEEKAEHDRIVDECAALKKKTLTLESLRVFKQEVQPTSVQKQ